MPKHTHPSFPGVMFDFVIEPDIDSPELHRALENAINWIFFDKSHNPADLGYLPNIINPFDRRHFREQVDANYHFGGWRPQKGFKLSNDLTGKGEGPLTRNDLPCLLYPGDPAMVPYAMTASVHFEEIAFVYPYGYVAIIKPDGSFEVARLD